MSIKAVNKMINETTKNKKGTKNYLNIYIKVNILNIWMKL